MSDDATPAKVRLTDRLGPLPEAMMHSEYGAGWFTAGQITAYAAEQVAAERERWESLARQALEVMENHRSEHAQSRISGVVYAFHQRLREYGPNV